MTKNFTIRLLPILILCLAIGVGQLFAQATGTGAISGTVSDTKGAVVPGASVTLTSKTTNATKTDTTNGDGVYQFLQLQPGTYSVKTTSGSFAAVTLDAEVFVGRTTDANVTLGASGVTAIVEVTGEGIQTTANNFDAVQNANDITNLPINGRRFQDFATLTPTAQVDPSRGQISLSGQRGINSNINVDGVDYNQPFFGGIRGGERSGSAPTIPQESIREFQVVAAGYSAEYGRSSGGIVNVVTKGGGNNVHGSLFYVLRPHQLSRGNNFTAALQDEKLNGLGITNPIFAPTQQQWGGSIGGPIKKDKLFYFGSAEMQRFRAPRFTVFPNLPAASTITARQTDGFNFYNPLQVGYTATNDAITALGKVDWNINNNNRFSTRFNFARLKAINGVSVGETQLDPTTNNALTNNGTEFDRPMILVSSLNTNFSSNVYNEARFQWAREVRPRIPNSIVANVNTGGIGVYGTKNFLPTTQTDKRTQFGDTLSVIAGNHTIKLGGEYSNLFASQTFGFNQTGTYSFAATLTGGQILDIVSPVVTPGTLNYYGRFDTTTARYAQQVGNLQAAFTVKEVSFFGQDSWRVNSHLFINYGIRYERQFNPAAQANNTPVLNAINAAFFPIFGGPTTVANIPNSQNEWGPRAGFAYDPKGDGKTVIRGYAGEYYARTPLLLLAGPVNNFRDPAGDLSVTLGSPAFGGSTPTATNASNFNFPAFFAANPSYATITGLTAAQCATAGNASASTVLFNNCAPNTVFRQFAAIGINLNSSALTGLPTLSPAQVAAISASMNNAISPLAPSFGIFQGATYSGITGNFRNPQSFQFGFGIEHEFFKGFTFGFDYSQVNTENLQRHRDINIPAPTGIDPVTGRVLVNRALRPLTSLGPIVLQDSSGRSRFYAYTARINLKKSWGSVSAYYVYSRNYSDDDNERDASGVLYDNPYDFSSEYYNARIDRRNQFVANPLFYLPYGFEFSSAIRLLSGNPINSQVGSDLNADGNANERPILVPGVELQRNFYTNKPIYNVDVRIQKSFKFGESKKLVISAEFFNILNRSNIQLTGSSVTNYCRNSIEQIGQSTAPALSRCGLDGITNSTFLQINDLRGIVNNVTNPNLGKINLSNSAGSAVFQTQIGARFYF